MEILADYNHPTIQSLAHALTAEESTSEGKLKRIFQYVRDDILFGFPPEGDFVQASQTVARGYGQCNTKGTLFLALCKATGIPARLHFSRISKAIQHGFFKGLFFRLMPNEITHSWIEVEIEGKWHAIDSYINDLALHRAAMQALDRHGWETGYSVSRSENEPSTELNFDNEHFVQMGAVIGDQGTWEEPTYFFNGPNYLNRPGRIKQWLYRLYLPIANHRVRQLRLSNQLATPKLHH